VKLADLIAHSRRALAPTELALEMRALQICPAVRCSLGYCPVHAGSAEAERFSVLSFETPPVENAPASPCGAQRDSSVGQSRRPYEAERLPRDAIELVAREMLKLGAHFRVDLAEVLNGAGRDEEALLVIGEARDP
jgi:hypothetical protein